MIQSNWYQKSILNLSDQLTAISSHLLHSSHPLNKRLSEIAECLANDLANLNDTSIKEAQDLELSYFKKIDRFTHRQAVAMINLSSILSKPDQELSETYVDAVGNVLENLSNNLATLINLSLFTDDQVSKNLLINALRLNSCSSDVDCQAVQSLSVVDTDQFLGKMQHYTESFVIEMKQVEQFIMDFQRSYIDQGSELNFSIH